MITIETEYCNPISQIFYDNVVSSIDLALLHCTCGHSGCLIWYGSYSRKIRQGDSVLLFIDENTISSILRSYRQHWRERLASGQLRLSSLWDLVRGCFALYSRPFMQIKTTRNKLFPAPT